MMHGIETENRPVKYLAVIFDMDGVLIDSELFYLQRFHREIVKSCPWITREDLYPIVGMDNEQTRLLIHRLAHKAPEDSAFDAELEQIYGHGDELYFPKVLYPEVPKVLQDLKDHGFQLALASSSPKKAIRKMLEECNLADYFSSVISGDEFRQSKPNPEIYQKTMEVLARRPEECLIVEDSTYGVEAGVSAGARVAARIDTRFPFDQSKASYFIHSLEDLREILF